MALAPGSRLGPYEISAALGAGGMGEVYKARDTRLDRRVALKVVSALLTVTPEVRARLEREARAISQLNHPHICTLYDVGREGTTDYLVLEYLEGETLEQRIARGPMPITEVVRTTIQICDALDRAHRAGFVHRDLKPANVMLTKTGAKLLDFGLAKAVLPVTAATMTARPLTGQGTILGTLHYMSPEQVDGHEADARSDIFSLGAVVFEMATGKRAFDGAGAASVMTAILRDTPPRMAALMPIVPASLDRVVHRCLEKNPDDRWQSAHDIQLLLSDFAADEGDRGQVVAPRRRAVVAPIAGAVALAALAYAVWQGTASRTAADGFPFHLELMIPEGHQLYRDTPELAVTRDGRRVAVTFVDPGGSQRVYIRSVDNVAWKPVAGTDGAIQPFWSPDGRRVGFFTAGRLKHVAIDGGPVQEIYDASDPRGAAWLEDDTIVLSPHPRSGIVRVPAAGGTAQTLTTLNGGETHRYPSILPGSKRFMFWIGGGVGRNRLHTMSVEGGQDRPVVDSDARGGYGDGRLVFVRDGAVFAQPFDLDAERLFGEPTLVSAAVDLGNPPGSAALAVAANGVIAYCTGGQVAPREIVWRDRHGSETGRIGEYRPYGSIALSPDQRRLAVSIGETPVSSVVWIIDATRGVPRRLSEAVYARSPVWRPDSQGIFYRVGAAALDAVIVEHHLAGGSQTLKGAIFPVSVLGDGQTVLGHETGGSSRWDIFSLRDGERRRVIASPHADVFPAISPDGHWIAWMSDESGQFEVYVARYPGLQDKERLSVGGGGQPTWRADGKELFFIAPAQMMAVTIDTASGLKIGSPTPLFSVAIPTGLPPYPAMFTVTRDGQKFALLELARGGPRPTLRIVSGMPEAPVGSRSR